MRAGYISLIAVFGSALLWPAGARAHCDAMDGPVVRAARKAIEGADINRVLVWVQDRDEAEVRTAFERTLALRKLGPEASQLAEMYFFETLVRLHRAGEGAPYTGLKPAGLDLGPAIPAADRAVESSSDEALLELLTHALRAGIRQRLNDARARRNFRANDVNGGREFVKAYVEFVHYVEEVYQTLHRAEH